MKTSFIQSWLPKKLLRVLLIAGCIMATSGHAALPLFFERHGGESGEFFVARTRSGTVAADQKGFSIELQKHQAVSEGQDPRVFKSRGYTARVVRFELQQASSAEVMGVDSLPGRVNYLIGNDPSQWRTGLPVFGKLLAKDVYPGIDVVYYGSEGQLEYDFVVAAGADPKKIAMRVIGADKLAVDAEGNLLVHVDGEVLRKHKPILHQVVDGKKVNVQGAFELNGQSVTFRIDDYNSEHVLVIDPILSYSTYLGGAGSENGLDIALGKNGEVYVVGDTSSANLPVTPDAVRTGYGGTLQNKGGDAFVAKYNNTGSALEYLTYLGGRAADAALAVAVDANGNAYVAGVTSSTNFPLANPIFDRLSGEAEIFLGAYLYDGFVAKLNLSGTALEYSTFLGGDEQDQAVGIAVDSLGSAYVTGFTESPNFPFTDWGGTNGIGGTSDAFIAKFTPSGNGLIFNRRLGGNNTDHGGGVAVDRNGNAVVTGYTFSTNFPTLNAAQPTLNRLTNFASFSDAFVCRFDPTGALVFSTFWGGWFGDFGYRIAVDPSGNAYITGTTASENFLKTITNLPAGLGTNSIARDVFVTKFDPAGAVVYSTTFGQWAKDEAWDIDVDSAGNAMVVGGTESPTFPAVSAPPGLSSTNRGVEDVFVAYLNADASAFLYSGVMGGSLRDSAYAVEVDSAGNAYISGGTASSNFPMAAALQPTLTGAADAFFCKISLEPVLAVASQADGTFRVSWPGFNPEFRLESAASLANPVWRPVTAPVSFSEGRHSVNLPPESSAVFRLVR